MAVPPGHLLTVENGWVSRREYWNPLRPSSRAESEASSGNGIATEARLPAILRDAVLSHLVSDVPVGVFLSGGIDSSGLVAVLSHNGVRANTFSLVFQEEEFNEGQYSRGVARCFGTEHQEIPVSQQDSLAVVPEALFAVGQPNLHRIHTHLASPRTRAA